MSELCENFSLHCALDGDFSVFINVKKPQRGFSKENTAPDFFMTCQLLSSFYQLFTLLSFVSLKDHNG